MYSSSTQSDAFVWHRTTEDDTKTDRCDDACLSHLDQVMSTVMKART